MSLTESENVCSSQLTITGTRMVLDIGKVFDKIRSQDDDLIAGVDQCFQADVESSGSTYRHANRLGLDFQTTALRELVRYDLPCFKKPCIAHVCM